MKLVNACSFIVLLSSICSTSPVFPALAGLEDLSRLSDPGGHDQSRHQLEYELTPDTLYSDDSNPEEWSQCPHSSCEVSMYGDCSIDGFDTKESDEGLHGLSRREMEQLDVDSLYYIEPRDDPWDFDEVQDEDDEDLAFLAERDNERTSDSNTLLGKRRTYNVGTPARDCGFYIQSRAYPGSGILHNTLGRTGLDKVLRLRSQNCGVIAIEILDTNLFSKADKVANYSTEHIEELQFVASLLQSALTGVLPSGAPMKAPKMSCNDVKTGFAKTKKVTDWMTRDSGKLLSAPIDLVFEAFGSTTAMKGLLLLENGLNTRKSKCFTYLRETPGDKTSPFSTRKPDVVDIVRFKKSLKNAIETGQGEDEFLQIIRETIGAWNYISVAQVARLLANTRGRLSAVFKYLITFPGFAGLRDIFREVETDLWAHAARHCYNQASMLIDMAETEYNRFIAKGTTPTNWAKVRRVLIQFTLDKAAITPPLPPRDY